MDERESRHRDLLMRLSTGGPLASADSEHATVNDEHLFVRDGGGRLTPRPQRRLLHRRLINEAVQAAPAARQDRKAIVLAGPPGAGKTSALGAIYERQGTPAEHWLVIDPDRFKVELLREALIDGTFETMLPPQVRELAAAGERFDPLEVASLVHEESGILARRLRRDAIGAGTNVVIDGTLNDQAKADDLLRQLTAAHYEVHVVLVNAPRDVVAERIEARWLAGRRQVGADPAAARQRGDLGGRWVPPTFADRLCPPEHPHTSICAEVARTVTAKHPVVRTLSEFRTERPDQRGSSEDVDAWRGRLPGRPGLLNRQHYDTAAFAERSRPTGLRAADYARPPRPPAQLRDRGPDLGR